MPSFFADLKRSNWGELDGRPVCHDYGVTQLGTYGLAEAHLLEADWQKDDT